MGNPASRQLPTSVKIYSNNKEGFISLLQRIGMLPSDIMQSRDQFERDIRSSNLFKDDVGAMIDLVVLGTCEVDMDNLGPDLLKAWDERPLDKKFMLVCIVHNGHTTDWFGDIAEWSRRSAFRVVPISDHVADYFRDMFNIWAESKDPAERLSLYEYIQVDPHYSISNFTNFPLKPKTYLADVPCSAALQGTYQQMRRDYARVFKDLSRLLREDPRGWGYQWNTRERKYDVDKTAPHPPFVLHLVGSGEMTVPTELQDVVVKDINLDAVSFYKLIQSMDIIVPSFSVRGGYLFHQASSTVHTAVMNRVPLLVTRPMLKAYPFLTAEGTILRPMALSEMEAIGLFRGAKVTAEVTGREVPEGAVKPPFRFNDLSAAEMPPKLAGDVKMMLDRGWKRSDEGFERLTREIWEKNENFVGRLLRDL
ncbi:hypothetical protein FRC01_003756 [Tulasnella sp. 417]|nr:hypothetical protein FRC01_003756 [Tulasnella sp. 417]